MSCIPYFICGIGVVAGAVYYMWELITSILLLQKHQIDGLNHKLEQSNERFETLKNVMNQKEEIRVRELQTFMGELKEWNLKFLHLMRYTRRHPYLQNGHPDTSKIENYDRWCRHELGMELGPITYNGSDYEYLKTNFPEFV